MLIPTSQTDQAILNRIGRDLRPALPIIFLKFGLAFGVGGALSLFVCARLGMPLSPFAMHQGHDHMQSFMSLNPLLCAVLCGVIFISVPTIFLRAMMSPLQFHILCFRRWWLPGFWIVASGLLVAHHSFIDHQLRDMSLWFIGAGVTYWFMLICMRWFDAQAGILSASTKGAQ